jgi:hypothetical protein
MNVSKRHAFFALSVLFIVACPGSCSGVRADEPGCRRADGSRLLLCDDFETDAGRHWLLGSNSDTWPASDFVVCGDGAGYADDCAAWSNRLVFDTFWGFWGYDAWRPFPRRNAFYVRWYQYISDPYVWGTLEDKALLLHDGLTPSITAYVATSRDEEPTVADSGPGVPFVANYQDVDWPETGGQFTQVNRFQNMGNNLTLQTGRWYLFEWYVKLNTPGIPDGVTRLWIDDATAPVVRQTLRLAYDDMRWLRNEDVGKSFRVLRLSVYHQRCDSRPNTCPPNGPSILDQWQRWDHVAVSTRRIGPLNLAPVCSGANAVLKAAPRRFAAVSIDGVTDPRQLPVTITIDRVIEEGPGDDGVADGRHPGRESRDVLIDGNTVLLRLRHGKKHTSSYQIDFTAKNVDALQCTGSVRWP